MRLEILLIMFIVGVVPTLGRAEESTAALFERCAPNVHATTMGAIVSAESGGNPLAVLDNDLIGKPRSQRVLRSYRPQTVEEATVLVRQLVDAGHSVDVGLGQVNSRNVKWLGISVEDLLDPCKNLRASQMVVTDFYAQAARVAGAGSRALVYALSAYNTGNFRDGIANGYVSRVLSHGARGLPEIKIAPPFGQNVRVKSVVSNSGGHGLLTRRPTLLEAKLASIDVERF